MCEKISIELDSKWVGLVKSPLYRWIVAPLTGVSVTFAPLFLYRCGQGEFEESSWWLVPVCFATIYLVPLFYFRLASEIITCIHQQAMPPRPRRLPKMMGAIGQFIRDLRGK